MAKSAQPRLGKGLNALLTPRKSVSRETPPADPAAGTPAPQQAPPAWARKEPPAEGVAEIPLDAIQPNPLQPRSIFRDEALDELARSIAANGVIQPIVVRPAGKGRYELVAGERRWRASRLASRSTIPAIVRELNDEQSLELAIVENLQREDLTPLERSRAYQACLDAFQVTPDKLADRLGESRSNIVNYLRLLRLDAEIQGMLERGQLGMGQARAVAGVVERERQLSIARLAARRNLSVRQVEEIVRKGGDGAVSRETRQPPAGLDRHLEQVEQALRRSLGMRVALQPGRGKNAGRVVIHYASLDEFDRLATRLGVDVD